MPSIRPPSADVVNDGCNVNNNIPDFGQLDDHSDDFDLESHPSDHVMLLFCCYLIFMTF